MGAPVQSWLLPPALLGSRSVQLTTGAGTWGVPAVAPTPWLGSWGGSRGPVSPQDGGSWCSVGGSTPVRAGLLTPASARHHFPASHAGARGPAQLCKQDPKPRGTARGKHAGEAGTATEGLGPWATAGPCPRPPQGWLQPWGAVGCWGSGRSCWHHGISPAEKGEWPGSAAGCRCPRPHHRVSVPWGCFEPP